jgi:double-stranded uracil-DNA glycosylase
MINHVLGYNLRILFIGINPHPGSDRRGVPFSNNKMFWYLLSAAGLLEEDRDFLKDDTRIKHFYEHILKPKYGYGLINLVDEPSRTVAEINKTHIPFGRKRILHAIKKYEPKVVCFIGKINYSLFIDSKDISYGWQPDIDHSQIYVAHAPHRGPASVRIKEFREVYNASK